MTEATPRGGARLRSGLTLLILLAAVSLAAPWLAPHDPLEVALGMRLSPPSWEYPLGTDQLGRCELSRVIHGGRISLLAGLAASLMAMGGGLIWGWTAGLAGRLAGAALMRVADVGLAFPGLLLALVLAGSLGPSMWSAVLALALAGWPWWARLTAGLVRAADSREFVMGGRAAGVAGWRLWLRYHLPAVWPSLAVAASLKTSWIVVAISALGYLGLGIRPPQPEWGTMLQESRLFIGRAPWLMASPGLAVFLVVLGCNLVAEGLRQRWQLREARLW